MMEDRVDDRCPVCGKSLDWKQSDPVFDRWIRYCVHCGWEEEC